MKRLVIIDGNAILHRAFHALPPLTTKNGELVNAVFGFTSMILRVINDLKPEYLVVTFDRPKPTFRKAMYAGYQAHRPKMDEGLSSQIQKVHDVLKTMTIPVFEVDGFEADDVIGTITNKVDGDVEKVIVTGDRDLLQLVKTHVKAYMPVSGISQAKLFGEKEVEEKFGIKASQMVDYKALVGDQSDNYPGVAGVGPKTAGGLLKRFGTLEGVYSHIGEIESEKLRNVLATESEAAALAKKLATIVRDVPINFSLNKCLLRNLDRPDVHKLFEDLGFWSLMGRLGNGRGNKELRFKYKAEERKEDEQTKLF